jgi:hypothetical protein
VKVPLTVFPAASLAEQFTVVVATGNRDPDAGEHVTAGETGAKSVADAVKSTAVVAAVASIVMSAGNDSRGAVVSATVRVNSADPVQPLAAVASAVNVNAPTAEGVPDTLPAESIARPPGSAPLEIAKVNGPPAPAALSACEYGLPSSLSGSVPVTAIA